MLIVSMSDVTEKVKAESLLLQLVEQQLGMASQVCYDISQDSACVRRRAGWYKQ
jgi:hypothetical protein